MVLVISPGIFLWFSSLYKNQHFKFKFRLDFTVDKELLNGCVTSDFYFMLFACLLFIYLCLSHRVPKEPVVLLVKLEQMAMM